MSDYTFEESRNSKETSINCVIRLDNKEVNISTGIGFFDHMLNAFAVHSGIGLNLQVKGDLFVDAHHTVEDTGIVLGRTIKKAVEGKSINRFASAFIPMDESLAFVSMDISSRPYLVFDANFTQEKVGEFDTCLVKEFFTAVAFNAGITLHMKVIYGENSHHMIEAFFKAFAYSLKQAMSERKDGQAMTTKGIMG